ncbi:MAG: metalloregulator ArsR/SmtB family transcription factor [Vulcanimicrobiaceae bacterium]|jgi:DNA-binding transcriptional ArsR family regulator
MVSARHPGPDPVFRALADPTRREILAILRERRRSVGEIASNFRVSRPAISKHLRLLREAGLVSVGSLRLYQLNPKPLRQIDTWLEDYKAFWDRSLERLKAYAEEKER